MADYDDLRKTFQELAENAVKINGPDEIKLIASSLARIGSSCASLIGEVEALKKRVKTLEQNAAKGSPVK